MSVLLTFPENEMVPVCTGVWCDARLNNLHVNQGRGKLWRVTSRERGNMTLLRSKHRSEDAAVKAANRLLAKGVLYER